MQNAECKMQNESGEHAERGKRFDIAHRGQNEENLLPAASSPLPADSLLRCG
jgi:hypothetical protein